MGGRPAVRSRHDPDDPRRRLPVGGPWRLTGGGRLTHVVCVNGQGDVIMPCGRCRQLLWEHGGADMQIETVSLGIVPMREVLPDAFGPEDLVAAAERDA